MRIFNPTLQSVHGKCHGNTYIFDSNYYLDLTQETGEWIMEKFGHYGLVDITVKTDDKLDKAVTRVFLVNKTMEGLEKYLAHLTNLLESWISLDTELKAANAHGTVLKNKDVREITAKIETTSALVKELEAKYKIERKKVDFEDKSKKLMSTMDALIEIFDKDTERQKKAREQESVVDAMLGDIIASVPKVSGKAHIVSAPTSA